MLGLCRGSPLVLLVAVSVASAGCATILGFEEFSEAEGELVGDGDGDGGAVTCTSQKDCGTEGELCVNGTCQDDCIAGDYFCTGETLYECNSAGDGAASEGLSEGVCRGGEVELYAVRCDQGVAVTNVCFGDEQCDPGQGKCMDPIDIDATEVTRSAYQDFLDESPDPMGQADGCSWNTEFEAETECMAETAVCQDDGNGSCDDHPQVCVDWCDAAAYCESRGRMLCGALGSGALVDFDEDYRSAAESEWMNACSAGGQVTRLAGNSVPRDAGTDCVFSGNKAPGETTYEVGTHDGCQFPGGSYGEIFDLIGNVAEWTNNCEVSDSSGDDETSCRPRGGAFDSESDEITCEGLSSGNVPRRTVSPAIGFRCCDH